jgi:hypothetical protein
VVKASLIRGMPNTPAKTRTTITAPISNHRLRVDRTPGDGFPGDLVSGATEPPSW